MKVVRIALIAILASAPVPAGGGPASDIRGSVLDARGDAIKDATIILRAKGSELTRTEKTDADGVFVFTGVASGEYLITVQAEGFVGSEQAVTVIAGSSPELQFRLPIQEIKESVSVEAKPGVLGTETSIQTTLVSKEQIRATPGGTRTNSTSAITSYVPGSYMIHNQLHVHGGHQVTWIVDGVPIPSSNAGVDVGTPFNLNDISYLEAQRGSYSAEYGDRTYGIFGIVPRTGFDTSRQGEISLIYGTFNLTDDFVSFGDHSDRFAYYASAHAMRTDYGLSAPTRRILHDQAYGYGGFGNLIFKPDSNDQFRLMASFERDHYEVPNDLESQAHGTRDLVRQGDGFVFLTWVRTVGPRFVVTASPFFHFASGNLEGGPDDEPLIPRHERSSHYAGAHLLASAVTRRHSLKFGLHTFIQRDRNLFGIESAEEGGVRISQEVKTGGNLQAFFIGDHYRPLSWLGLTAGLRITRFDAAVDETAVDPRIGATLRLPRLNWVLHGFYGRYYQEPPLSTVSGPLLEFVAENGFGILPLRGERNEEHQFGITFPFEGWWIDAVHYRTGVKNFLDHAALGASNIFFPVTIERARIRGVDVSVTSPPVAGRLRLSFIYSRMRIEGQGAITGGLTDFSPPAGFFFLDHDQRHTLKGGFSLKLPWNVYLFEETHYGSGFTDNEGSHGHAEADDHEIRLAHLPGDPGEGGGELVQSHLPGRFRFDVSIMKNIGKSWTVSLNSWNVLNSSYLLDNSPSLGGVHWVTPRQVWVELRYRFHY